MCLLLCVLLSGATTASAFDATKTAERVAVLRGESDAQIAIARALRRELRERGFDAFDAERTYAELMEDRGAIADYYVEIAYAHPRVEDYGGIGIGGRHADVELGIVVSRLNAELRIYDGETLELLSSENLSKRKTALLPTSVGIGGGSIYAVLALPLIERAQQRRVARAAARDAAAMVVDVIRGE